MNMGNFDLKLEKPTLKKIDIAEKNMNLVMTRKKDGLSLSTLRCNFPKMARTMS
jgi:hypothetical protein